MGAAVTNELNERMPPESVYSLGMCVTHAGDSLTSYILNVFICASDGAVGVVNGARI